MRVIDGDTIETSQGTIRLLGINTPEKTMPYSNSAKEFLNLFLQKNLTLIKDREDLDKYKRKLRYIFFESRFLNLEILESGWGNAYMTSGLFYETQFLNAQKQAINLQTGIWEKSNQSCSSCINLDSLNPEKEYFTLKNNCTYQCELNKWFVKDTGRNVFYLNSIKPNQIILINSSKEVWNNNGDTLFLFDDNGKLVFFYEY